MKKTDLAYTAGIIDGEGCIRIDKQHNVECRGGFNYRLQITVSTTDKWLAEMLRFAWGGSVHKQKANNGISRKEQWRWAVVCQQAIAMLESILPYLVLKRPQAELAIRFQNGKDGHRAKTDEELALMEAQFILMKSLKNGEGEIPSPKIRR